MMNKFQWMSLSLKGLRHELLFAFGLVAVAVLVFVGYLFPGISSIFILRSNLVYVVVLAFVILFLSFRWILQMMINPVITISREAKKIADGDYTREIKLMREDEIGELGEALNRMTWRIRENMEELKTFSEKTEAINAEINQRILSLSSLLQISNLISQNANLDEILQMGLERCLAALNMTVGCLILKDRQTGEFAMKMIRGSRREILANQGMDHFKIKLSEGILGKAILKQEVIVLDKNVRVTSEIDEFRKLFSVAHAVITPLISRGAAFGVLVIGSDTEDHVFSMTDKELLDLLAKQIAIAIENDLLASRVARLEIIDNLTGLFNRIYAKERLDEEIKRAISFQRPCAFVIFTIDQFKEYHDAFGNIAAENILMKFGSILKENIRQVDKAARFGDHEFALILPERNKRQAIEVAEEIRRKIENIFFEEKDPHKRLTLTGAVSENPVDGISADELISKARDILVSAKKQGGNRICYKI